MVEHKWVTGVAKSLGVITLVMASRSPPCIPSKRVDKSLVIPLLFPQKWSYGSYGAPVNGPWDEKNLLMLELLGRSSHLVSA